MKTLDEKIEKMVESFKETFITSNDWGFEFATETFRLWLREEIKKVVKESLKEVELKRKGNSLEKTLEEFVNNSNIHLGYNNAVSDQLQNHKKYLKEGK